LTAVESTVGDAAISGVGTGIPIALLEFVAADAGDVLLGYVLPLGDGLLTPMASLLLLFG